MPGEKLVEQQLEVSLYTAINSLIQSGYRYAVIGGIALSQWEIIRATFDIDIKVLVQDLDYSSIRNYLYSTFPKIARNDTPENPFIVSVKVEDVTVDFLLTLPGY
jgi:hypothetical protein